MNRLFFQLLLLCLCATLSQQSRAQLGDFFQAVKENLNENIPQIETINHRKLNANELKGDYTYLSPCLVFENNNLVNRVSGIVASGKVEQELIKRLSNIGLHRGRLKLSLKEGGQFVATLNGKKITGHYEVKNENIVFQDSQQLAALTVNAKCEGKKMVLSVKCSQVLPLLQFFGQQLNTQSKGAEEIANYCAQYTGIRLGLRFEQ